MADKEALLRLRLAATNEASPAFKDVSESMASLRTVAQDAAKGVTSEIESITKSLTDLSKAFQLSTGDSDKDMRGMETTTKQTSTGIEQAMSQMRSAIDSVARVAADMTKSLSSATGKGGKDMSTLSTSAREAASGVSKSFSETSGSVTKFERSLADIAAASYRTREQLVADFDGIKKSFGSESLAAVDASQLTTAQLKKIVESAHQTKIEVTGAMKQTATNVEQSANQMGSAIDRIGGLIGLQMIASEIQHIGSLGLHMFTDAIKQSAEFEANMSRVHAVLMGKEPHVNMKALSDEALKLGLNSKFSANEIAQGMYDLARQGLSSTQILGKGVNGAIQVVNDLAQATDSTVSDTATVVTDVVNEYGISGSHLRGVADMISGALHNSSESLTDFYYSMRQVGPVASNMHQSVEDTATALALLGKHGITSSVAGTSLKNMLLGLSPHTKKAAQLMHDLGISAKNGAATSFYELNGNLKPMPQILDVLNQKFGGLHDAQKEAALSAVFTKYGLAGLNVVAMEGRDKFEQLKKALAMDKASIIAQEKMNNLQGDILRLKAALATTGKAFGDSIEAPIRKVVQSITALVQWFGNLSPASKKIGMDILGFGSSAMMAAGAITSIGIAVKLSQPGFALMGTLLKGLMNPWGLLVIGIVAGVVLVITHWKQINDWVKEHFGKTIPQMLQALGKVFTTIWNGIKDVVEKVWKYVGPTIINGIKEVQRYWKEIWPQLKQLFEEVWNVMQVFIKPMLAWYGFIFKTTFGAIKASWHDIWNAIKDAFKLVWDSIKDSIKLGWDFISGLFKIMLDLLTGKWGKAWDDLKSMLGKVWGDIKKLFGDFVNDGANFGKDLLMGILHGVESAVGSVITGIKGVVNSIKGLFGGGGSAAAATTQAASSATDVIKQVAANSPKFGVGGKVSKPTLAWVGEGGESEYIIPESKLTEQTGYTTGLPATLPMGRNNPNGGGHTFNNTFIIQGAGKDGRQIGNEIVNMLRQQLAFAI